MDKLKNYDNYYITKEGKIFSDKRGSLKELSYSNNIDGYKSVRLYKNGKVKRELLHVLLAKQYIDNPNNLPVVNHVDGDKTNNNISNLEWCTRSYNTKHSFELGLQKVERGEQRYNAVLNDKLVREIRTLLKIQGISKTARDLGLKKSTVANVKYGAWKHIK